MKTRHTFVATGLVALLALAGVTAAIAAGPAGDPPPRIAFLANGIVPADALAAGPIAGQLGAPLFTTQPDTLSQPAADGLDDADPELVIVLGGPVAVSDTVVNQAAAVTGLTVVADPDSRPDAGIVRAAGQDRFETAQIVAQLLGAYDPAYLGVDLTAVDADLLDGKDSTAFQPAGAYALAGQACTAGKVVTGIAADGTPTCATDQVGAFDGDADTLDGRDSTEFQPAGDYALANQKCGLGSLVSGITAVGDISCSSDEVDGGDAQTLDGLNSTDFALSADALTWLGEAVETTTTNLDDSDPDTVLVASAVTLGDECGDGTTEHRVIVDATLSASWGPSTPGADYEGVTFLYVDGGLNTAVGTGIAGVVGETDAAHGMRSTSGVVRLGPGAHTLELVDRQANRVATDATIRYFTRRLVLTHAGWTCG